MVTDASFSRSLTLGFSGVFFAFAGYENGIE